MPMTLTQRPDGWWIVDVPDTIDECGPYRTRAEAEQDRVGLARFFRHEGDARWFEGTKQLNGRPVGG
jgi:hypothetical protein